MGRLIRARMIVWSSLRIVPVAWLLFSSVAPAQELPRPAYRFFSVVNASELEQKLNEAAGAGYRLAAVQRNQSNAYVAAIADRGKSANTKLKYSVVTGQLVHVWRSKEPKLVDVLNAAGQEGCRFVPNSWLDAIGKDARGFDSTAIVECGTTSSTTYEYFLSWPINPKNVQKDVTEYGRKGFRPVIALNHGGSRNLVLMERASLSEADSAARANYQFFSVHARQPRSGLAEQFASGYRPLMLIAGLSPLGEMRGDLIVLLEKTAKPVRLVSSHIEIDKNTKPNEQFQAMEEEMNKASAEGFRVYAAPAVLNYSAGGLHPKKYCDFYAAMEPAAEKQWYRVLFSESLPELSVQVSRAAQDGYHLVSGGLYRDVLAIMEKSLYVSDMADSPH